MGLIAMVGAGCMEGEQSNAPPPVHPRLFFSSEDIPVLREQAETTHQDIWQPIITYALSQRDTLPPASAPANADEDTFRQYGNRLIPLSFACVLSDRDDVCNLALTHLRTYLSWEQWDENGHRDLGHSHMLLGCSLGYDWLYARIPAEEQETMRVQLAGWAQKLYEASSLPRTDKWNNWWWKSYMQNHHWVNNSALGMASLVLSPEQEEESSPWFAHASQQISHVQGLLEGVGDGSWHEGLLYQDYGLTMLLAFATNAEHLQETPLTPNTYMQNYVAWRLYNHLPNGQFLFAHGDFEWSWINGAQTLYLLRHAANRYQIGYAEWLAQELLATIGRAPNQWSTPWYVFEFFAYDPALPPVPPYSLPWTRTFPDFEGVIWRTGWDSDSLVFGLKTGAYGGRHAVEGFTQGQPPWELPCYDTECQLNTEHDHDDTNTIYLARGGTWLVPEHEGYGLYEAQYHNTLLIDGKGQFRPPLDHYGQDPEDFIKSDGFLEVAAHSDMVAYVAADATHRYQRHLPDIQDVTRHVIFVRPNYLIVVDRLIAQHPHIFRWIWHLGGEPQREEAWWRVAVENDTLLHLSPRSTTPLRVTAGREERPSLRVANEFPLRQMRVVTMLVPAGQNDDYRPTMRVVEDRDDALAVEVEWREHLDTLYLLYEPSDEMVEVADIHTNARLVVTSQEGGRQQTLFVAGGMFLFK